MKKKLWALLLSALLILGCAGCGDSDSKDEDAAAPDQTEAQSPETDPAESEAEEDAAEPENPEDTSDAEAEPAEPNTLVFMNGASFTNMKQVENNNYEDGTYFYEDLTEDGATDIVNRAILREKSDATDEEYLERALAQVCGQQINELQATPLEETAQYAGNPAYHLSWMTGGNEDTREYVGVAVLAEHYTYVYYFSNSADLFGEMADVYQETLNNLTLEEVPAVG